jgi:hypothetical protein
MPELAPVMRIDWDMKIFLGSAIVNGAALDVLVGELAV